MIAIYSTTKTDLYPVRQEATSLELKMSADKLCPWQWSLQRGSSFLRLSLIVNV